MVDSDYDHGSSGSADQRNENEASLENDEPEFRSRGGLMERIAARAGFNAPRLITQAIRPTELSKKPEISSPYSTVSPGLSPTTLLESPVFLSNSMVLPSPTTGKFSFAPIGNNQNSTLTGNIDPDKGKENTYEDINASSFAFKPISESTSFPYFSPLFQQPNLSKPYTDNNGGNNIFSPEQTYNSVGIAEHSPLFDEDDGDGTTNGDPNVAEDGYNWRKYRQKHVKGSEHPRSYYKCTHQNCPVKKKVERSLEGHITEIIYKGAHDHPKPPSNRISALGSTNELGDMQLDCKQHWKPRNLETVTSSAAQLCQEYGNGASNTNLQAQSQTGDVVDVSSTISNDGDDNDDRATHGSISLGGYEGEGDELESKRRRIEAYAPEVGGASRGIREPRVVVQTTSEVDILDDGYRWRKYGQKVVKGNPNPRSYYKCTSPGCNVRKHVERACHDLKSVITTYEGKHNHDIPPARNTSQQGPNTGQFERPSSMASSFNLPNRLTQLGPRPRPGFGVHEMHQHALGYVLPKGEPRILEAVTQTGLNSSNGSSVYQQMMSRLP